MEGNYIHKDRTEVTKEEEGRANKYKHDRGDVKCYLEVEDTLNSLFSGIQKSKKQLHTDMEALRGGILQTIRDDKENKDSIHALKTEKLELEKQIKGLESQAFELQKTLKESQRKNNNLEGEVGDLKNETQKLKSYEEELEKKLLKSQQEREELSIENTRLKIGVEDKIKSSDPLVSELTEKLKKTQQEKEKLQLDYTKLKKDLEDQKKKSDPLHELKEKLEKSQQEKEKFSMDYTKLKKDLEDQMKKNDLLVHELKEKLEKSQQEKEKFSMDNTKLKKDLEDQMKKSDLLVHELKEKLDKSQQEKEKFSMDNTKLKKDLEDQMKKFAILDSESRENLEKSLQEKEQLKMDKSKLEKDLEDQIRSMESDKRRGSFDSNAWVKVSSDSNSEQKCKSSHESDKAKEDAGKDKLGCQNEIKEKEKEEKAKNLMEDLYTNSWVKIYSSLMKEQVIDIMTAQDILYRTLWYSYKLMLDTKTNQPGMSATNSNFPHTPESEVLNNTVPELAQGSMAGVKPEDSLIKVLEEKLMEALNKEYNEQMEYLNQQPQFATYVTDCLQLCHYLVFNSNHLHLKSHNLDIKIDEKFFTKRVGHKEGRVYRVIFPALILLKGKKIITLRKGILNTTSTPYDQS